MIWMAANDFKSMKNGNEKCLTETLDFDKRKCQNSPMKKLKPEIKRNYGGVKASAREEERRNKLIAAGLEAFGTTGFAKTTIKHVCELAGLTERYFYESFKTKEELLGEVYSGVVEGLIQKTTERIAMGGSSPQELIVESLGVFYKVLAEDPRKARMLFFEIFGVSPEIDRLYQTATMRLSEIVSQAVLKAFPVLNPELFNKSILPVGLAGAVDLIAAHWSLTGFTTPIEEILGQVEFLVVMLDKFLKDNEKGIALRTGNGVLSPF